MAERILTRRELNRAVLARQLLLERSPAPLPRALERIGGIQAQYAPSMYVGLWSRLRGFERRQLTSALERRAVVQATLMRTTIHLVSREDYWPLMAGLREARRAAWVKAHRGRVEASALAAAARKVRARAAGGVLHRKDLEELAGKGQAVGVGLWIELVRAPPSGTWDHRRADLFACAEDWLGPAEVSEESGIELLVRRYLQGFGPAAPADIANWAGLPARAVTPVLGRLKLRRFRDESGAELVDLPRLPLPAAETPAPVRFLPTWDATLLAHARRSGILPEEHRPKIFHVRNPQSEATFLVDGVVAGAWRYADGRIALEPFGRLDRATRRELEAEAAGLAELHA